MGWYKATKNDTDVWYFISKNTHNLLNKTVDQQIELYYNLIGVYVCTITEEILERYTLLLYQW